MSISVKASYTETSENDLKQKWWRSEESRWKKLISKNEQPAVIISHLINSRKETPFLRKKIIKTIDLNKENDKNEVTFPVDLPFKRDDLLFFL